MSTGDPRPESAPDLAVIGQLASDIGAETTVKLMKIFDSDAQARLAAIRAYLNGEGSLDELHMHAHSLKGLCSTYGAPRGSDAALALQEACKAGDPADIEDKARKALEIIPVEVAGAIQAAQKLAKS